MEGSSHDLAQALVVWSLHLRLCFMKRQSCSAVEGAEGSCAQRQTMGANHGPHHFDENADEVGNAIFFNRVQHYLGGSVAASESSDHPELRHRFCLMV